MRARFGKLELGRLNALSYMGKQLKVIDDVISARTIDGE